MADAAGFKTDFGRSSLSNPCPACTVGDWCVYPGFGIGYTIDFLESGNPGGWTSSLKTFDEAWNIPLFSEVEVDVWLNDCPENMVTAGFSLEYDSTRVNILSVEAYDSNYLPGPWDPIYTDIRPDYNGPGTYFVQLAAFGNASPDGGDDIIIVKLRLSLTEPLQTNITFHTVPGFEL